MAPRRRSSLTVMVALAVAGCQLPAGTHAPLHAIASAAARPPVATPSPGTTAGVIAAHGGSIVANNGGGLVTDHGTGLAGVVRAPAGLVSDLGSTIIANNAGNIVANNGGNIVANNGGGLAGSATSGLVSKTFRLMALDEPAIGGLTVSLLDASGKPALDAKGQPLVAKTDATGHFRFDAFKPSHNMVLSVDLKTKGSLTAIAPTGATTSDVDVVSSLTTGYILDKYVKTQQADPQTTLDKLPPDVEADTRAKAAKALDAAGNLPTRLTPAEIDPTVDALRQKDQTLDQQMETVKKLLVAAGQSDFGSGRLGTDVTLSDIHGLVVAPDGSVYLAETDANRVWRLLPDGHIVTALGTSVPGTASIDGASGPSAAIIAPVGLSIDATGRVLTLENTDNHVSGGINNSSVTQSFSRVTRLGLDGKVQELWSSKDRAAVAAYPGTGDEVRVLVAGVDNPANMDDVQQSAELWAIGADRQPHLLHNFTKAETNALSYVDTWGVDATGRLVGTTLVGLTDANSGGLLAVDPTTYAVTMLVTATEASNHGYHVDATGDVLDFFNGTLARWQPSGDGPALQLPPVSGQDFIEAAQLTSDGAFLVYPSGVYKFTQGQLIKKVGASGKSGQQQAGDVSLEQLTGLAAAPDGGIYVNAKKLLELAPGGLLAPAPVTFTMDDHPGPLHTDAAGALYVVTSQALVVDAISRVDASGNLVQVCGVPAGMHLWNFAVAPDGSVMLATVADSDVIGEAPSHVFQALPDGTFKELFTITSPNTNGGPDLAYGPDGALYVIGGGQLWRWTATDGAKLLKSDAHFYSDGGFDTAGIALDARGRLYIPSEQNNVIVQYDIAADAFKTVAGHGGTHFTGSGVDDSLLNPHYVVFDKAGNLYFSDIGHKQVKRIPAGEL